MLAARSAAPSPSTLKGTLAATTTGTARSVGSHRSRHSGSLRSANASSGGTRKKTADAMADQPRFDAVAADVGLASRSLARRFEQELGMTWRGALRRLRVLRAIELLAGTEATVTQIAMDVGYTSLSAFESAFRDLVGRSPTEYRSGFEP